MASSDDWTIRYEPGEITRRIMWNGKEVAIINPAGDFDEQTESDLSAGIAHAGKMHRALKRVAEDPGLSALRPDTQAAIRDVLRGVETIYTGKYVEPDEDWQ